MTTGTANKTCMQVKLAGEWIVSCYDAARPVSASCNAWLDNILLITLTYRLIPLQCKQSL